MSTTGGHKLRASLRAARALPNEIAGSVGFHDPHIASLAASHEYGLRGADGGVSLPERPAFRQGSRESEEVVREATAKVKAHDMTVEVAAEIMAQARDTIRSAYRNFAGVELGEAQEARKRGTPGAGKQLVGHRGEKLISHIEARVNDVEVT